MRDDKDLKKRLEDLFSDREPVPSTSAQPEEQANVVSSLIPEKDVAASKSPDRDARDTHVEPGAQPPRPVQSAPKPAIRSALLPQTNKTSATFIRRLNIGIRLGLGFSILVVLSLILGVTAQIAARAESEALEALNGVEHELFLVQTFQRYFLEGQGLVKDFLLQYKRAGVEPAKSSYALPARDFIESARNQIEELISIELSKSIRDEADLNEQNEVVEGLDTYKSLLLKTIEQIETRGSGDTGLEGALRQATMTLEAAPEMATDSRLREVIEETRHFEEDWLLTESPDAIENVRSSSEDLRRGLSNLDIPSTRRAELQLLVDDYLARFDALVELQSEFDATIVELNERGAELLPHTDELIADETVEAEEALERFRIIERESATVEIALLVGTVVIGVALSIGITRSIARPVSQLIGSANQLAQGELSTRVQVQSKDELGVLAATFNSMASQLQDTLEGLEQRVTDRTRALKISSAVSRRLSTILSQTDLVSEVVNQVRTAFDYYHVHIYLVSEDGQELIMTGGTGEAGRSMLAQGHRIAWSKGLVGRAAESDTVVLVPDVSQEPGWLSNPLLQDTRSEAAVPISAAGKVLGVLDVQHNIVDGLGQSDAELLQSIANQVAVALHNARLYESSKRKAESEALVNKIGQRIQNTTTLDDLLKVAARELGQALGAQRTSLQLSSSLHATNDITTSLS